MSDHSDVRDYVHHEPTDTQPVAIQYEEEDYNVYDDIDRKMAAAQNHVDRVPLVEDGNNDGGEDEQG